MFLLICFSAAEAPASQNKPSAARAAEGDSSPKTTPEKINRFSSALTLRLVDVGRVNMQNQGRERQRENDGRLHNVSVLHEGCFQDDVSATEIVEQEVELPCGLFPLTTPHLSVSFRPVCFFLKRTPELLGPACAAAATP